MLHEFFQMIREKALQVTEHLTAISKKILHQN